MRISWKKKLLPAVCCENVRFHSDTHRQVDRFFLCEIIVRTFVSITGQILWLGRLTVDYEFAITVAAAFYLWDPFWYFLAHRKMVNGGVLSVGVHALHMLSQWRPHIII